MGVRHLWERLAARGVGPKVLGAALAVFVASQAVGLALFSHFGLSYYNLLVGGLAGAERAGFDVTFWGECADEEVLSFINARAPQGSRVAAFPMGALYVYNARQFGLLRGDIEAVESDAQWDCIIIANRGAYLAEREDLAELTSRAVFTKSIRGVPAAWVVERERE